MSSKAEQAHKYHSNGYNCAQSVMLAFAEDLGLDFAMAARLTNCLGGGFAQTGGICGAVSAACLALSARFGREGASREGEQLARQQATYRLVQQLQQDFAAEFGAVDCPALLEKGLEASGDQKNEKYLCAAYVQRAAELVEQAMAAEAAVGAK